MRIEQIGNATLYHGDALEVLQSLDVTVDALITDPPYSSGGIMRGDRANKSAAQKYVQGGSALNCVHNKEFSGDNRDARSWGFWTTCWLALVHKKIKTGGYALCFTDWRQLPMLTDAFQAGGFVWRGLVPWDKTGAARAPHTGYFRHQCEYVVWGTNGPCATADNRGPWPGFVQVSVNHREKLHMTGKPVPLMGELVKCVTPGGLILDPFMGSASTGVAGLKLGYKFIGIEKDAHYFDVACKRLEIEMSGNIFEAKTSQCVFAV